MKISEIPVTLRVLHPSNPENWLTDGENYSKEVYLGSEVDAEAWREVSGEEYDSAMAE